MAIKSRFLAFFVDVGSDLNCLSISLKIAPMSLSPLYKQTVSKPYDFDLMMKP